MSNDRAMTSFDELYMQYHSMVYGISLSVVHNEESAKDIVQEVFIKLYQWRNRINNENKIKGWLCVTARNMSLNYIRKYKNETELGEVCDPDSNPEGMYINSERNLLLRKALYSLKDSYVEVLTLKYALDFSVREISASVGLPIATVYTRLRRAEEALEKRLREAEE